MYDTMVEDKLKYAFEHIQHVQDQELIILIPFSFLLPHCFSFPPTILHNRASFVKTISFIRLCLLQEQFYHKCRSCSKKFYRNNGKFNSSIKKVRRYPNAPVHFVMLFLLIQVLTVAFQFCLQYVQNFLRYRYPLSVR